MGEREQHGRPPDPLPLHAQVNQGLQRAMNCLQEAIMMVDVSKPGWRIMHLNQAAIQQTGVPSLLLFAAMMCCSCQGTQRVLLCCEREDAKAKGA